MSIEVVTPCHLYQRLGAGIGGQDLIAHVFARKHHPRPGSISSVRTGLSINLNLPRRMCSVILASLPSAVRSAAAAPGGMAE